MKDALPIHGAPWPRPAPQLEPEPEPDAYPHSYEAEQGLLGAILTNNRVIERVPLDFRSSYFADPLHARIFDVLRVTTDRGQTANPITLRRAFEGEEAVPGLTVQAYLIKLATSVVAIVNAEDYARTIVDAWARRSVIGVCREIISETAAPDLDRQGFQVIEEAEARIHALADGDAASAKRGLVSAGEGVDEVLKQIEDAQACGGVSGLATGLTDLDRLTAGLHRGSLVILGARPSMGKSDLAVNVALNAAKAGKRVGFFSLEMSRGLLINRLLARMTKIPASDQIGGQTRTEDLAPLVRAAGEIRSLPLWIDDAPAPTVEIIASRGRRPKRRHGLDLVVVDYLQLIAPGNNRRGRQTNRTEDVTLISQGLKALAKELEVPVLALCQLSRAVEAREDKRPQLADLRESGGIEQDADVVMFVYRDSYYLERSLLKQGERESAEDFAARRSKREFDALASLNICDLIVPKQRMGRAGATVTVYYKPEHSHFGNLDEREAA